jgi:putative NADH-flavin reductase
MRVVIAGGHGKIALLLEGLLAERGDQAVGLIRNPAQAGDVQQAGAEAVVCNLEAVWAGDVAVLLAGADAVVFAAGAGPGSGVPRKDSVDRAASVLLAEAAERAGVRRFVQISSMGAGEPPRPGRGEVWAAYITAKTAAEADLRRRDLDWTIVRPGGSRTLRPPAGSGSHPRRCPLARFPAPTSPRSLPPCSTNRVPGTRHSSWSAETARSPRPCTPFPDRSAARIARPAPGLLPAAPIPAPQGVMTGCSRTLPATPTASRPPHGPGTRPRPHLPLFNPRETPAIAC